MHPQFIESSITFVMAAMMAAHTMARSDRSHSTRGVVALMGALMIWTGSVALARVEPDRDLSYVLSCTALFGAFLVPPAWAWLAMSFTERVRLIGSGRVALWVFAPTACVTVALVTNPLHGQLVADPQALIDEGPGAWAGPIFWPWIVWAYLLVLVGSALFVRASLRLMRARVQARSMLMVAAALLPLSSSVLHTIGLTPQDYDRTPLLLGISTVLLYLVDWRFRLLDTMPIARRDVIDQLEDGVVVADPDGLVVHMNAAAEQMSGRRLIEVVGQPLSRVVEAHDPSDAEPGRARAAELVREMCASAAGFETRLELDSGRVYEIRGASVCDIEGDVAGFYLILRDRTAAARYEGVLRQSRRTEAVTVLAAGIAHEVNNPLAYVRANVTHLIGLLPKDPEDQVEVGVEVRDVLQESLEGIDRIGSIVDRLQRLANPEGFTGSMFDVNEVVRDAVAQRGFGAPEGVELDLDLDPHVPSIYGSRDGLLHSLVEVLENADRAVAGRGHVHVWTEIHGEAIRIGVADDGPGVAREDAERVFDPFFTTRTDAPGSGLGLAMAAKAIGDLGGSIEIAESPQGGARVVIRLPLDPGQERDPG